MALTRCTKCKRKRETRKAGSFRLCQDCWNNAGIWVQAQYPAWREPPPEPSKFDIELAKKLGLVKEDGNV